MNKLAINAISEGSYQLSVTAESFKLKSVFRISRGAKTHADVIVVNISDGENYGWSEAVPYSRYSESVESVLEQFQPLSAETNKLALANFYDDLSDGSAKNALDCALWDLAAKQQKTTVAALLSTPKTSPAICAQTLSIDTPANMAKAVAQFENPYLVKVKLDNQDILGKMRAIRDAAPESEFIIDANEGWSLDDLTECIDDLKALDVVLIEQPLASDDDDGLEGFNSPIPLCADESCHTRKELSYLRERYQVINIKLDKTGGLSEANALAIEAKELGFDIMLGCMVGSSLAMAPASLLTSYAKFVDLDGPLLIANDRENGFSFEQGRIQPVDIALWGGYNNQNQRTKPTT